MVASLPLRRLPFVALLLAAAVASGTHSGCTSSAPPRHQPPAASNGSQRSAHWAQQTLAAMSLRDKAAQMIMVRAYGQHRHPDSAEYRELQTSVAKLGVGGIVVFDSDLESIPRLIDSLQRAAKIPLLIAADLERGLSFRVRRGASELPTAMALGATRSPEAARFAGELTGREARAVGIHWTFAPVLDVNNNPANPVINVRSFGEDPELVATLGAAFIDGTQTTGVLTTAKHFPGHGDTGVDSHYALPVLTAERQRLESVELLPFRRAIAAGVDSVMTGHLSVPALDPSGTPASLSRAITHDLLRDELGFDGLIVTDAMEMKGAGLLWAGGGVVQAIRAGADVVLLPADTQVAIQSIVRAVAEGQLDEQRIDDAVARILRTKAALDLTGRQPAATARWSEIARPDDLRRIDEIAGAAVTVVRNRGELLPLHAERRPRILHLVLMEDGPSKAKHRIAASALARRGLDVVTREIPASLSPKSRDEILGEAAAASQLLVSAYFRRGGSGAAGGLSEPQIQLIEQLQVGGQSPILLSFGSPYLFAQLPEVPAYVCAYGASGPMQEATIAAILGETATTGKLPVSLPGLYRYGHGIELAATAMTLPLVEPQRAGFEPGAMDVVDQVITDFVAQRAFPGAVVAVGHRGALAHLQAFGSQSYAEDAPAVTTDTLYDLASLTKVIATTTMAMILVDDGRLDLDAPIQDFLPLFAGDGKAAVTVRQLLTHSSGIDWWAPLYEQLEGQAAYVEQIQAMPLAYAPGTKTLYSDLGLILLGEILERVAGQPLEQFAAERIFEPLGMESTLYRPGPELLPRIAPTEVDSDWRGRLLHGEVHDENAHALGGVAPHAGLFGTAGDLARLAQMLLNGGVFEHHRIVSAATIAQFTRRAGLLDSTRALGWDTKSAEGSSAGTLFSPSSFGHTGFTGTSLWIDPERELFVILLTNRVHPTRENKLIRKVRPAVADAVIRGLAAAGR